MPTGNRKPDAPCSMCGGPRERPKQAYCRRCANLYKRAYRMVHGRESRRRDAARAAARYLVRIGALERKPCEECGAEPAEAHHDDYDRVADVRWLCTPCHAQIPKDQMLSAEWQGRVAELAAQLRETG